MHLIILAGLALFAVLFVCWLESINKTQQEKHDRLAEIHARLKKIEEENKSGNY